MGLGMEPSAGRSFLCKAAVLFSVALSSAACTSQGPSVDAADPSTMESACSSPSRILDGVDGPPEVEGSSEDGLTLYGQVQSERFLLASEVEKKIVWRISGSGEPAVTVTRPGGGESSLAWGPEYHSSSNYDRPGDEYGTALVLDEPGCWHIGFTRESGTADVWLQVGA